MGCPAAAATTRARTKSGLPPERATSAASVSAESGESLTPSASSAAACSPSGSSSIRVHGLSGPASAERRRAACREDEPGSGGRTGDEVREEEMRGVVEPVHVLDDEEGRHHQEPFEQRREHVVSPVPRPCRVERVHLGRRVEDSVEREREER